MIVVCKPSQLKRTFGAFEHLILQTGSRGHQSGHTESVILFLICKSVWQTRDTQRRWIRGR